MHSTTKSLAACNLSAPRTSLRTLVLRHLGACPHWPPKPQLLLPGRLRFSRTPPCPPAPLRCLTPPCLAASPTDPRHGEGRSGFPPQQLCFSTAGRPPFKASRLPSPPPSRRGLQAHPGGCAGARGLHTQGKSAGRWSKSLRAAWASRAADLGTRGAARLH